MGKHRKGNIARTMILAVNAVIETADFQSFVALVEYDVFQRQLHRAPYRPAEDFLKRRSGRGRCGRRIKNELEVLHGEKCVAINNATSQDQLGNGETLLPFKAATTPPHFSR